MSKSEVFTYPSADQKTNIHAMRWTPDSGEFKAILQITHGMTEYLERYTPFAEFLVTQGFMVVAHDHVGHGDSVQTIDDWGHMETGDPSNILVADMHTLRTMIQQEYPETPYFMLGHSMGSFMLRKYICLYGQGLYGAIIMGTGSQPDLLVQLGILLTKIFALIRGWRFRSRFIESLAFASAFHKYDMTGQDVTNSWLSKNPNNVSQFYSDPKCTFKFTLGGYLGLFSAIHYINKKQHNLCIPKDLPLLLVSGSDDPVGNNGKGVITAYHHYLSLNIQDVTIKLYPGDRHEILNELDHQQVFEDLVHWMESRFS